MECSVLYILLKVDAPPGNARISIRVYDSAIRVQKIKSFAETIIAIRRRFGLPGFAIFFSTNGVDVWFSISMLL